MYPEDTFTEELLIKPFYSEQLYAHFQFTTKWHTDPSTETCKFLSRCVIYLQLYNFVTVNHTRLFPRALGELVQKHSVQELHVSLTGGLWRYEKWGYPVVDAAPGAEVWAWFKPDTVDIDNKWKLLANSLSGLLCASINFIDSSNSINPQYTFQPRGVTDSQQINSSFVR